MANSSWGISWGSSWGSSWGITRLSNIYVYGTAVVEYSPSILAIIDYIVYGVVKETRIINYISNTLDSYYITATTNTYSILDNYNIPLSIQQAYNTNIIKNIFNSNNIVDNFNLYFVSNSINSTYIIEVESEQLTVDTNTVKALTSVDVDINPIITDSIVKVI